LLPAAFLVGVQWGVTGLAIAWIAIWPVHLAITAWRSLPVIGLSWHEWLAAVAPPTTAAVGMAVIVSLLDRALPPMAALPHLLLITTAGAMVYGGWLFLFARKTVSD